MLKWGVAHLVTAPWSQELLKMAFLYAIVIDM